MNIHEGKVRIKALCSIGRHDFFYFFKGYKSFWVEGKTIVLVGKGKHFPPNKALIMSHLGIVIF